MERHCWHDGRPYADDCIECQKYIYEMLRQLGAALPSPPSEKETGEQS